jgi:predicted aspartyl protease
MRWLIMVTVGFTFVGCTVEPAMYQHVPDTVDQETFQRDFADCRVKMNQTPPQPGTGLAAALGNLAVEMQVRDDCMRAKGYVRVQQPAPGTAAAQSQQQAALPKPANSESHTPRQEPAITTDVSEIAFRCPAPGTVVEYNTGAILTFSGANGFTCAYSDRMGNSAAKYAAFSDDTALLNAGLGRLWPLRIGTELTVGANQGTSYRVEKFTVLRKETVVIAAGSFDTIVVGQVETGDGQRAKRLLWYAPEPRVIVKSTFTLEAAGGNAAIRSGVTPASASLVPGDYEVVRVAVPVDSRPPATAAAPAAPVQAPPASAIPATGSPVETVHLVQQHGTFLVPVQVNGRITLDFVLDSGAADVAIPADVVLTLIRTGTVSDKDFIGTKTYVLADGSKLPSPSFIIHELRVGDFIVKNVTASVSPMQGDPLLGQSFLSKLPTWMIDNKQHALIIGQ